MIKTFCTTLSEAMKWIKDNWQSDEGYNICMSERKSGRAPKWAQELITTVKSIDERLSNVEHDVRVLKRDMELVKSLPTIQKEIAQIKSKDPKSND